MVEGSDRPLTIVEAAPVVDGPGWRLRFREVPDRNAADGLRDAWLETVVDPAHDLEPGAAYWHQVVGAAVVDEGGRRLGTVADVYRAGAAEVLVVEGGPAGSFDVPVVLDIIREFAPAAGRVVVDAAVLDLDGEPVDAPTVERPARRRPRWSRHGKGAAPRPPEG